MKYRMTKRTRGDIQENGEVNVSLSASQNGGKHQSRTRCHCRVTKIVFLSFSGFRVVVIPPRYEFTPRAPQMRMSNIVLENIREHPSHLLDEVWVSMVTAGQHIFTLHPQHVVSIDFVQQFPFMFPKMHSHSALSSQITIFVHKFIIISLLLLVRIIRPLI